MKKLHNLTLQQYEILLNGGMLWVYYPHATGIVNRDLQAVPVMRTHNHDSGITTTFYDIRDEDLYDLPKH